MKRQSNGQLKYKPFKRSNFHGLALLLFIMSIGAYLNYRFQPVELHRPIVGEVKAIELPVQTIVEAPKTEHEAIIAYIKQVFGDQSDNAFKILECENAKLNPNAINHNRNGSTDHSIFQVNSIHSKRYGEAFKTNWKANIDTAYKIYQSSGWSAWSCSHKINVIPFYLK